MKGRLSFARWSHICAVLFLALGVLATQAQAAPASPQVTHSVYLPLINVVPPPAPQPASSTFFLPYEFPEEGVQNINSTNLVVDARGGVHMTYEIVQFYRSLVYAYCPANCTDASKFTTTVLAVGTEEDPASIYTADLQLDLLGRPRIMWQQFNEAHLVWCNASCGNKASWTDLKVHDIQGLDWEGRPFVIDEQGGYHYVYADDEVENVTYYLYCPTDCTTAANWTQAKIADREHEGASLAVTSDGRPRFVFTSYDDSFDWYLGYAECNADCLTQASWTYKRFDLFDSGSGSYSLRLDAQDRPRLALAPWYTNGGSFPEQEITYMWCNAACAAAATVWGRAKLPVPGEDISISSIAMELDGAGRPAVAFNESGTGMILARCSANCESAAATWGLEVFESTTWLNQNVPVPPKSGCSFPTWSTGYDTAIALDGAGKPRVSYDTNHLWLCGSSVSTDIKWARYKQW
ncbi:MAG TPA: hypothetical protein VD886_19810 [Herpetosiphonaceae bacterium]|nr:hypothetical protein [Herpetosiphonaceae bacterium]